MNFRKSILNTGLSIGLLMPQVSMADMLDLYMIAVLPSIPKSSLVVREVINDIRQTDLSIDDIDEVKNTIKTKLENAPENDKDAALVNAFFELAEIANSSEVSAIVDISADFNPHEYYNYLSTIIFGLYNESLIVDMKDNILYLSQTSTDLLYNTSLKLQNISDTIEEAFSNKYHVFSYEGIVITYNQSLMIRAGILSVAAKLKYHASFDYTTFEDIQTKTTTLNNMQAEYTDIGSDPVSVLSREGVYALSNGERLTDAENLFLSACDISLSVDASKEEKSDKILEIQNDANKIKEGLEGQVVTETSGLETYKINLENLFNSSTVLDKSNTLGVEFEYVSDTSRCDNWGFKAGAYSLSYSQYYNESMSDRWVSCDSSQSDLIYGVDNFEKPYLDAKPSSIPMSGNSHIDDVFIEYIDEQGISYQGDDLINHFFN